MMPFLMLCQFLPPSVGLPRQVPCAGIDHVGIRRIDCQRLHLVNLPAPRRADLRPREPASALRKTPSRVPANRIFGSEGACAKARIDCPRRPSISLQLRPLSRLTHNPPPRGRFHAGHKDRRGIRPSPPRYGPESGRPSRPAWRADASCAAIQRLIEPAVGRSQIKMVGLARHRSKGARVAAVRSHRSPCRHNWSRRVRGHGMQGLLCPQAWAKRK